MTAAATYMPCPDWQQCHCNEVVSSSIILTCRYWCVERDVKRRLISVFLLLDDSMAASCFFFRVILARIGRRRRPPHRHHHGAAAWRRMTTGFLLFLLKNAAALRKYISRRRGGGGSGGGTTVIILASYAVVDARCRRQIHLVVYCVAIKRLTGVSCCCCYDTNRCQQMSCLRIVRKNSPCSCEIFRILNK